MSFLKLDIDLYAENVDVIGIGYESGWCLCCWNAIIGSQLVS